tara:strand:+ start:764 stop:1501 length:738 start_codon:yes stop_codon:yes gene_type:complete
MKRGLKLKMPSLMKNKYVLYVVFAMALVNVLGYLVKQDYNSIILFVAVGILSNYFTKNMTVNLLLAILVTALVAVREHFKEGFDEKKEKKEVNDKKKHKKGKNKKKVMGVGCEDDSECKGEGSKCIQGMCKTGEGMGQRNVPSSKPANLNADENDSSEGDRIDYASTLEQAYDNLQNMLGSDGMKGLADETKKLVSQQKDLMQSLNSMAPVLSSAKNTLDNLDLPNASDLTAMLKNLNGSAQSLK